MKGTRRNTEKGDPTVHLVVRTRSRSRQESQADDASFTHSQEECGQRVDLEPLLESPSVTLSREEITSGDESERTPEDLVFSEGEEELIEDMAEARGPAITPPRFRGSLEENVEEYLQAFERVAKANAWNPEKKLVILPCYLEGAALKWYENLEQAEGENLNWTTVKDKMKGAFQSIAWEEQMEYKLRMRMQGEEEQVESYIQDVLNLCSKLDVDMSERCKIKHVLRGLKPSLLEKVMIMENDTLESLLSNVRKVQTARFMAGQRVDQLMTELPVSRTISSGSNKQQPSGSSLESKIENLTSEFSKFSMRLMEEAGGSRKKENSTFPTHMRGRGWSRGQQHGGGRGHFQGHPQVNRGSYRGTNRGRTADGRVICYKCNRVGHFAINCRSSQSSGSGNEEGGR